MGKASSSKKVAKAAAAGESRRVGERRPMGFPALVAGIIILGLLLVGWARSQRDAVAEPTLTDHWHSAYGIYDCTSTGFRAPLESPNDPEGIHSHQDSLIHVHPFTANVTGKEAKMGVFFEAMGVEISESEILIPGQPPMTAGVECQGEEAVVQVLRWGSAATALTGAEATEVITTDFNNIRFLSDGEAFTIALAPLGAEIPPPESIPSLSGVGDSLQSEGPVTDLEGIDGPGVSIDDLVPSEDEGGHDG